LPPAAKVHRAREFTGQDHIARAVDIDRVGCLKPTIAESLAPDVLAVRVQLDHEGVRAAEAGPDATAEVDRTGAPPRDDHMVIPVYGDGVGDLIVAGVAESLAPDVLAVRVELDDEDVRTAGASQRIATEVEGTLELPDDDHGAGPVDGNRVGILVIRGVAEALAPDVLAVGGELGDEDVPATEAGEIAAAKVGRALELTRDDHVGGAVDGHRPGGLVVGRVTKTHAPDVVSGRARIRGNDGCRVKGSGRARVRRLGVGGVGGVGRITCGLRRGEQRKQNELRAIHRRPLFLRATVLNRREA